MTATKRAVRKHIHLQTRAATSYANALFHTGECATDWLGFLHQANSPTVAAYTVHPGRYRKMGPAYLKVG